MVDKTPILQELEFLQAKVEQLGVENRRLKLRLKQVVVQADRTITQLHRKSERLENALNDIRDGMERKKIARVELRRIAETALSDAAVPRPELEDAEETFPSQ